MDSIIVGLAGKVMTILMPYASKTAQEFINTVGEVGYEKAKALFNTLKRKWTGDSGSSVVLENFEKQPAAFKPAMEAVLQQKLSEDEDLKQEINRRVEEIGPVLEIIQRMDEAENVTGLEADALASGKVSVEQDIKKGKNITGAKLGRIG